MREEATSPLSCHGNDSPDCVKVVLGCCFIGASTLTRLAGCPCGLSQGESTRP
jgi:hypothetical protein